jgi:hypothetical protein
MNMVKKIITHIRVIGFWMVIGFSIYGFHHFMLKINAISKLEAIWFAMKFYLKWG